MFAYKVGGSKKGPKYAYVIYEWSLIFMPLNVREAILAL